MFGRLLPRETSFFGLFEQHAALAVQGSRELQALAAPGANVANTAKRIKEIEHEADVITHRCVEALHKTFITPVDRNDIHRLISRMDDILDYIEAAADRVALYELTEMTPEMRELAAVLVRACEEVHVAVKALRDTKNTAPIFKACVDVNRLENEADLILRSAVAKLFKQATDPILVIKWKEVYENMENATDRCEDVANIIEGIVLEHA